MNEELRKENEKLETQLEVLINSNKELGTELEHRLKQEKDLKDKLALIQSKLKITDREINLARTKIIPNNIEKWRKLNSCSKETTSGRRKADYVTIKVEEGFNLNECLERWNNGANNQLMGSGANTTIHAWLDHWNVQYEVAQELRPKRKKARREAKCEREMRETFSAKGEGGTTRQFLSEVWRQMSNIKQATVRGSIDQYSETASSNIVKLFPSESNNGYLMPLSDDFLDSKTRGDGYVDYQETINAKYRAIGRCILVALLGQNPIAHHVLPDIYRNYLILGIDPTDERYELADLVHQLYAMFSCKESGGESAENKFDTVLENIKHSGAGVEESGATPEKMIREFAKLWYIDNYKQALDAIKEGLSCKGKVDISECFFNVRPEVFSAVMFAKQEEDIRVQDVLVSLELGYIKDSEGESLPQDEDQAFLFSVDESKEKNDETRVSGMLIDFIKERAEQEGPSFLIKFVMFVTGHSYIPGSGLQMTVDFARNHDEENGIAGEMSDDALPMAHTCPMIIKFPFTAYHRNYGKLKQKLEMALEYMSNFNMN